MFKAKLSVTVRWELDGWPGGGITRVIEQVPIMVKVGNIESGDVN